MVLKHAIVKESIPLNRKAGRYEFGVKVGIATTLKGNLIVGAKAFAGNPHDGHTLNAQLEQISILVQDNKIAPSDVFVDLGYRGVDANNPTVAIKHRGKYKSLSVSDKHMPKRRQAIEPITLKRQLHRRCQLILGLPRRQWARECDDDEVHKRLPAARLGQLLRNGLDMGQCLVNIGHQRHQRVPGRMHRCQVQRRTTPTLDCKIHTSQQQCPARDGIHASARPGRAFWTPQARPW
jgi:hypothetical protein